MSSRHKCWQLGKKYAVNVRWPSAAAELQTDFAYFLPVCSHALQELFSLSGKSTVLTCCFSPAGLLSLLAIAWVSNLLADTGVLSQPLGEACQSPGAHWKLSAATVPRGNLIYSHFPPSFICPSLLRHLARHGVFTLRKGVQRPTLIQQPGCDDASSSGDCHDVFRNSHLCFPDENHDMPAQLTTWTLGWYKCLLIQEDLAQGSVSMA